MSVNRPTLNPFPLERRPETSEDATWHQENYKELLSLSLSLPS